MNVDFDEKDVQKRLQQMAILELEEDEDGMRVPNWLVEVLAFITRKEIVHSSMNTSARIFEQLCWPKLHGNIQLHNVPYLFISRVENGQSTHSQAIMKAKAKMDELEIVPIPSVPPPDYITGFDWIRINSLDEHVLQFFECIAPLYKNRLLKFKFIQNVINKHDGNIHQLLRILAKEISILYLAVNNLSFVDHQFGEILDEVQGISLREFELDFEIISKWLAKKRTDGKHKMLHFREDEIGDQEVDRIKEEFLSSTRPSNFIIWQQKFDENDFEMENEQTGEILTLYRNIRGHRYLARFPKGEDHWKEEMEKKIGPNDAESVWITVDTKMESFKPSELKMQNPLQIRGIRPNLYPSHIIPAYEILKEHIQKILTKERAGHGHTFEELYRLIFTLVLHRYAEILYSGISKTIREHVQTTIRHSIAEFIPDDHFVENLNNVWNEFNTAMELINGYFLYMNREYSQQMGLLPIKKLGLEIFATEIFNHEPVKKHLNSIFGEDLVRGRDIIDGRLLDLIKLRICN